MKGVPARWYNYTWYGDAVLDRFVALKVPLTHTFSVPPEERFTPLDAVKNLPLGLIIDLTDTYRYYQPQEFTSHGVEHIKLRVRGHVVPNFDVVQSFFKIVNGFLQNRSSKDKLIGVHCTHGVNRTGYLICAYLIQEMGYNAEHAIRLFNQRRGYNMERENYLESLHSMSLTKCTEIGREPRIAPDSIERVQHSRNEDYSKGKWRDDRNNVKRRHTTHRREHVYKAPRSRSSSYISRWDPISKRMKHLPASSHSARYAKRNVFEDN